MTNERCNCPNGSHGQKHTTECYETRIERLQKVLRLAVSHIDMAALRISHQKDWGALASFQGPNPEQLRSNLPVEPRALCKHGRGPTCPQCAAEGANSTNGQ
jgi:hypothetical protein